MTDSLRTHDEIANRLLVEYYGELDNLTAQANDGELDRDAFLLALLALIDRYGAMLYSRGGGSHLRQQQALATWKRQQSESADMLAHDIYSGAYRSRSADERMPRRPEQTGKEGAGKLAVRMLAWAAAAWTARNISALLRPDDILPGGERRKPRSRWLRGPTEKGCKHCIFLDGAVMLDEDWQRLAQEGFSPQSRQLKCKGYHCLCGYYATDAEPTMTADEALARLRSV